MREPGLAEMLRSYWSELSPHKGILIPQPDWGLMARLEEGGVFKLWCCRVEGSLAGFISFMLHHHIAYRNQRIAVDAGHFLAPAFRDKGRVGYRMWASVKPALRAEGIKIALLHDNATRPLMPFFLAIGAEPRSTIFSWNVGEDNGPGRS